MAGLMTGALLSVLGGCVRSAEETTQQVCFADHCIKAEVARTQEERARGLQLRASLGTDEGMLFVFPSSRLQGFWMKDTLIALDMIWMDEHKRIVTILNNVLPCETEQCPAYLPDRDAQFVLEVNAGVASEMGIKVGDQAVF